MSRDVVVLSAVVRRWFFWRRAGRHRTVGTGGGGHARAVARSRVDAQQISYVTLGNVVQVLQWC